MSGLFGADSASAGHNLAIATGIIKKGKSKPAGFSTHINQNEEYLAKRRKEKRKVKSALGWKGGLYGQELMSG